MIDRTFLENNLFEESKIGDDSFPWTYEVPGKYRVTINQWTDGKHWINWIYIMNYVTCKDLKYYSKPKLTKEDLHRCVLFMDVPDEFEYENQKTKKYQSGI